MIAPAHRLGAYLVFAAAAVSLTALSSASAAFFSMSTNLHNCKVLPAGKGDEEDMTCANACARRTKFALALQVELQIRCSAEQHVCPSCEVC